MCCHLVANLLWLQNIIEASARLFQDSSGYEQAAYILATKERMRYQKKFAEY